MTTSHDDFLDDEVATVTYGNDDDSVAVIIGSGAGGGTLANELAQRGIDVVVIEAGPRFKETGFENDEYAMYDLLSWTDPRSCTGSSPIAKNFADAPTLTCKGVGGTTSTGAERVHLVRAWIPTTVKMIAKTTNAVTIWLMGWPGRLHAVACVFLAVPRWPPGGWPR